VALVERLGNETNVSVKLASAEAWLVVLDGDHNLRIGESVALSFEAERAIIFGADGAALHPDGA
jgi:multiple sugar transport system ATP-binding protein